MAGYSSGSLRLIVVVVALCLLSGFAGFSLRCAKQEKEQQQQEEQEAKLKPAAPVTVDQRRNVVGSNGPSCQSVPHKDGKGRNVFLDVGSCQGDTIEMFYHHGVIPGRETLNPEFRIPFPYDTDSFDVFAFEANPQHTATLRKLEKQFNRLRLITETAVWTTNSSQLTLHIPLIYGEDNPHQGSSVFANHRDMQGKTRTVKIPTLDFNEWLERNIRPNDFVMMKMNIEGAEFPVLKHMQEKGTLKLIHKMWIWFHGYALPPGEKTTGQFVEDLTKQIKGTCTEIVYQKQE